jgi:hypothetical protein
MARPVGTPKTTRMRKLACESCANIAYQSRARIGQGFMLCPCGSRFIPADVDDAALLMDWEELREHPAMREHARLADNAQRGQVRAGASSDRLRGDKQWRSVDEIAAEHFARIREESARASRIAALKPYQYGRETASDEIPF